MPEKETYYFEITDTFSGEANYCWASRYKVEAFSIEDAIAQLIEYTGYNFQETYQDRWDAENACVCVFDVSESVYHDPSFANEFKEI